MIPIVDSYHWNVKARSEVFFLGARSCLSAGSWKKKLATVVFHTPRPASPSPVFQFLPQNIKRAQGPVGSAGLSEPNK